MSKKTIQQINKFIQDASIGVSKLTPNVPSGPMCLHSDDVSDGFKMIVKASLYNDRVGLDVDDWETLIFNTDFRGVDEDSWNVLSWMYDFEHKGVTLNDKTIDRVLEVLFSEEEDNENATTTLFHILSNGGNKLGFKPYHLDDFLDKVDFLERLDDSDNILVLALFSDFEFTREQYSKMIDASDLDVTIAILEYHIENNNMGGSELEKLRSMMDYKELNNDIGKGNKKKSSLKVKI